MTTLKDFIKENSPDLPAKKKKKKKKRRLRLKNLNPFRKRKYKTLEEEEGEEGKDGNKLKLSSCAAAVESAAPISCLTVDPSAERRRSGGDGARDSKGDEGRGWKRVTFGHLDNKCDSTECLLRGGGELTAAEDADEEPAAARSDDAGPGSGPANAAAPGPRPGLGVGGRGRGEDPRVAGPSDEIESLDDGISDEGQTKAKKKKSTKKKLKKAGIGTAKMLGYGLSSFALSFQYLTPETMATPVAKEIAKRQEDRYREVSLMAYVAMGT